MKKNWTEVMDTGVIGYKVNCLSSFGSVIDFWGREAEVDTCIEIELTVQV